MAKRQRWKEDMKSTLLLDDHRPKKKPKIEILEDVVYKDGIKVRSTSYHKTKFKSSPEHSSLPTTPHSSKPAQVSVKDLTPTFRKPKLYMSEVKRIIENNISTEHSTQQKDKKSDDFIQTSTSLETLSNLSISDLIQKSSHASYNCLVTVDDDESLVSLDVYTEDCPKNKDCLPYTRMKPPCTVGDSHENKDCLPNTLMRTPCAINDSLENKDCLPNTLMKSPCTAEDSYENKDCLPYTRMKSSCTAEDSHENKECLPNTLMKSACTAEDSYENKECLPYTRVKSPCTDEDSPENKDCLTNTLMKSPCTAKYSPENKDNTDCLQNVCRVQTSICAARDSSAEKSKDCLSNVHKSSSYTNKIASEKMHNVTVTDNKYITADYVVQVSSPVPIDTNVEANNSTNSQESSKTIGTKRNCRRKLSFDKSYLDFFEEEDADTLLLNEAFPSEESSCAFGSNETSDDSLARKAGKKKNKKKRGKKLKKKISQKKNVEEIVLLTKAKPKKDIKTENKIKKLLEKLI